MRIADTKGLTAVSMRRVAQKVGVEAMSLYHHVENKADLLDGMVDAVLAQVEAPEASAPWRPAIRTRCVSLRAVLKRHPWAISLLDSRANPGDATLAHHNAVLGCFRRAGFSVALSSRSFSLLDSYVFGFVVQEQALPFTNADELRAVGEPLLASMNPAHEHLYEVAAEHMLSLEYDFDAEFAFGLDLILDGLARERRRRV